MTSTTSLRLASTWITSNWSATLPPLDSMRMPSKMRVPSSPPVLSSTSLVRLAGAPRTGGHPQYRVCRRDEEGCLLSHALPPARQVWPALPPLPSHCWHGKRKCNSSPLAGKSGSLGSTGRLPTHTNTLCQQVIFTRSTRHAPTSDRVLLIRCWLIHRYNVYKVSITGQLVFQQTTVPHDSRRRS